jgi:hypothetical protein
MVKKLLNAERINKSIILPDEQIQTSFHLIILINMSRIKALFFYYLSNKTYYSFSKDLISITNLYLTSLLSIRS